MCWFSCVLVSLQCDFVHFSICLVVGLWILAGQESSDMFLHLLRWPSCNQVGSAVLVALDCIWLCQLCEPVPAA